MLLNITLKIKIILEKPVKFLIVKNLHYKDGYIDTKPLKILKKTIYKKKKIKKL